MSIGLTILCVGLAFRFFVRGSGMEVMTGVGMLAITFGCALFTIRGYTITRNALLVHRLLWNTRLPLDGLKSARFELGAMRWGIRCGNGGFFSFTGLFYNRKLGFHRAFVTDHIRTVVLRYPRRIVVVSPADPEAFVRDLAMLTAQPKSECRPQQVSGAISEMAPRFSGLAVLGAAWALFFLAAMLTITLGQEQFPQAYGSLSRLLLFLCLAAPLGATILGWLATTQIRRSTGGVRGLELAVFDGLLFPLLGLDLGIAVLWLALAKTAARWRGLNGSLFVNLWDFAFWILLLIMICAAVDFLIARRIWRGVNQPFGSRSPATKPRWTKMVALALGCGLLTAGVISFTAASLVLCARNVDNVNLPFVDDPQAIGQWTNVDFVWSPEDFKPGAQTWKGELPVFQKFSVLPGGRTSYRWLIWTRGQIINPGERTAASYEIRNIGGTNFMFMEWKNGDYILFHSKPGLYVLRQNGGSLSDFHIGQAWFPEGDSIAITSVERSANRMVVKGHYNLASHAQATLALHVTTPTDMRVPEDSKNRMQISNGRGEFELVHSHLVPGLPHVAMYADGKAFANLYFGTQAEALEEGKAKWIAETRQSSSEAMEFGPVIERVIDEMDAGTNFLLDLDTGEMFRLPSKLKTESDVVGAGNWYARNGIDVRGATHSWSPPMGLNLIIDPVPRDYWDELTQSNLEIFLRRHVDNYAFPGEAIDMNADSTCLFKTREGGIGLLQFVGFTENPRGVKIRYKLVQNGGEKN